MQMQMQSSKSPIKPLRQGVVLLTDGARCQPLLLRDPVWEIDVGRIAATSSDYLILRQGDKRVFLVHDMKGVTNKFWTLPTLQKEKLINFPAACILLTQQLLDVLPDDLDRTLPRGPAVFFKLEKNDLVDYPKAEFEVDWPRFFEYKGPALCQNPMLVSFREDRDRAHALQALRSRTERWPPPAPKYFPSLENLES